MKKTLSILLTLMLLVGLLAIGTVSASAGDHIHSFDKNGTCTACGAAYSFDDYQWGEPGFDKSLSFQGATSLTVKVSRIYTNNDPVNFYDGQGNLIQQYSGFTGDVDYTVTIPGDTMRLTFFATNDVGFFRGQGKFGLASITPNYDNNTGSVLSEGNLWIVFSVAGLAVVGIAALAVVKKKKNPAAANGANVDDEE